MITDNTAVSIYPYSSLTTTTTASASAGATTITVASATNFPAGTLIRIAGAGTSGGKMQTLVTAVAGNVLTLIRALVTGISSGALIERDNVVTIPTNYGYEFADADFGTPIRRVNADDYALNGLRPEYSQSQAVNADQTLMICTTDTGSLANTNVVLIFGFQYPHPLLSQPTGAYPTNIGCYRWDPVDPRKIWIIGGTQNINVTFGVGATSMTLSDALIAGDYNPGDKFRVTISGTDFVGTVTTRVGNTVNFTPATPGAVTNGTCFKPNWIGYITLQGTGAAVTGYTITKQYTFDEYAGVSRQINLQELSKDGRYMALYARKTRFDDPSAQSGSGPEIPDNHEIFAFDTVLNSKSPICVVPHDPDTDPGGSSPGSNNRVDSVDHVTMSPSGRYIIVMYTQRSYLGWPWTDGTGGMCYDRTTGLPVSKFALSEGHVDYIEDENGVEWAVQDLAAWPSNFFDGAYLAKIRLSDGLAWLPGQQYTLNGVDKATTVSRGSIRFLKNYTEVNNGAAGQNIHVSARGHASTSKFAVMSQYGGGSGSGVNDREITRVYLDSVEGMSSPYGIADAPHFERLVSHRSVSNEVSGATYGNGQPHATISPKGDYILFGSNYGSRSNKVNCYIADIDWYSHFSDTSSAVGLKAWRKSPYITNRTHKWMDQNGWIGLAFCKGQSAVKDGLFIEGTTCDINGRGQTVAGLAIPYGNDLWKYEIEYHRYRRIMASDPNPYNDNTQLTGAKTVRRVVTGVTGGTTVQISQSSFYTAGNTGGLPNWTTGPAGTHIDIWDWEGTTKRTPSNIEISALQLGGTGLPEIVFATPVNCSTNDIMYATTDGPPPTPTWFSYGSKPWIGHPYTNVKTDTTRNKVLVGPKNSGKPECYTNHVMQFDPVAETYSFLSRGLFHQSGTRIVVPGKQCSNPAAMPNCWEGTAFGYNSVKDELMVYGGGQNPCTGPPTNGSTFIYSYATGNWTEYVLSPNPGRRDNPACIFDPKRNRFWIFGSVDSGNSGGQKNSVYYLDCTGATPFWVAVTPTGTAPNAKGEVSCAYDPVSDTMVVAYGRPSTAGPGSQTHFNEAHLLHLDDVAANTSWEALPAPAIVSAGNGAGSSSIAAYLPAPRNCLVLLDKRNTLGPETGATNYTADPHFMFLRVAEVSGGGGGPPPPPTLYVKATLF